MDAVTGSMILQGVGATMNAFGAFNQSLIERMSLRYEAAVADLNTKLASASAESVLLQGADEASRFRVQVEGLKSQQRVAMIANGLDINSSETAKNILESTDYVRDQDISMIKANAARAAFGYKTQAINYQTRASSLRSSASLISPLVAGASTFISGATGVANSWTRAQGGGSFGGQQQAAPSSSAAPSSGSSGFQYQSKYFGNME